MELVLAFAWITLITIIYIDNMMRRRQTKEAPQGVLRLQNNGENTFQTQVLPIFIMDKFLSTYTLY